MSAAPGVVTRPAWRGGLAARGPRIIAGLVAAVVMVAGVRAIVAGPPAPPVPAPAPPAADGGAEGFAEGFVRAYLAWDPEHPEAREAALAAFVSSELDPAAGLEPPDRSQVVRWTAVVAAERHGFETIVTVAAEAGGRRWHLAVPVTRDERGFMAVAAHPALVGPPPTAEQASVVEEDEVTDAELAKVAERAVTNYLPGESEDLAADLDRTAVVSLPAEPAAVERVESVTRAGRGRVAVALTARVDGARLGLRYELEVVRRERWYVRTIMADPRGRPEAPR